MCVANPGDLPIAVKTIGDWIHAPIGEMINPTGSETTLWASLSAVGKTIWWISGQMILSLFVIILMRALIKIGFSFSELTKEVATKITDSVESFAGTIPLIPLPGVGAIGMSAGKKFAKSGFWLQNVISERNAKQEQMLKDKLWLNDWEISSPNLLKLKNMVKLPSTSLDALQKEIKTQLENNYITQKNAQSLVETWLSWPWKNSIHKNKLWLLWLGSLQDLNDKDLKKLWTDNNKTQAYKLLNRLFNGTVWVANDTTSTKLKYGGSNE